MLPQSSKLNLPQNLACLNKLFALQHLLHSTLQSVLPLPLKLSNRHLGLPYFLPFAAASISSNIMVPPHLFIWLMWLTGNNFVADHVSVMLQSEFDAVLVHISHFLLSTSMPDDEDWLCLKGCSEWALY